jgi:type II secretory pathway component PulF
MARFSSKQRATFYDKMSQLQRAGVPLREALSLATAGVDDPAARKGLRLSQAAIDQGSTLTEALSRAPALFSPLERALCSAGEVHGRLDKSFAELADLFRLQDRTRRALLSALVYPAFLLALSLVLPNLPIAFSSGASAYGKSVLHGAAQLLVPAGLALIGLRLLGAVAPASVDALVLGLPVLGASLRRMALSRFCRALAALLGAGVEVKDALGLAVSTLSNRHLVRQAEASLRAFTSAGAGAGKVTLAGALTEGGAFPAELCESVAIGERAGSLTETLERAAESYEDEAQARLQVLVRMLPVAIFLLIAARIASQLIDFYSGMYIDNLDRTIEQQLR